MTARREFSPAVKASAFLRASGRCESCTARLVPGKFAYDHVIADALGGSPTLENCAVLCTACHAEKTAGDTTKAAKVKRITCKLAGGTRKRSAWPKAPPGYNPWTRRIET